VTHLQGVAVRTHCGAMRLPPQPNGPPIRTFSTCGTQACGAVFPPTTAAVSVTVAIATAMGKRSLLGALT
jgi:hypothetical protein